MRSCTIILLTSNLCTSSAHIYLERLLRSCYNRFYFACVITVAISTNDLQIAI